MHIPINTPLRDAIHKRIEIGDYVLVGFPIRMNQIHQVIDTIYEYIIVDLGHGKTAQYKAVETLVVTDQLLANKKEIQ